MEEGLVWKRRLGAEETDLFLAGEDHGRILLLFRLDVKSERQITAEIFKEAFHHLYRKCPNLSVCVRKRDNELWFLEMQKEVVDFEFLVGADNIGLRKRLMKETFDTFNGPCWRCVVNQPCPNETIYSIFTYFNHGTTDGLTNTMILSLLLEILEDLLNGDKIDDNLQIGSFMYENELKEVLAKEKEWLLSKPDLNEKYVTDYKQLIEPNSSVKKYYKEYDPTGSQETSVLTLSKDETLRFIKKCKEQRVTVNSAFVAALNIAHVEELKSIGVDQESYELKGIHWINFRRHMEHGKNALGCFIGCYALSQTVPAEAKDKFWDYSRELHAYLHPKLIGNEALHQEGIRSIIQQPFNVSSQDTPYYHYHLSNYTKIDLISGDKPTTIEPLHLERQLVLGPPSVGNIFVIYTFAGKITCCLDATSEIIDTKRILSVQSRMLDLLKSSSI